MQSVRKAEQAGALSGEMPRRSVRETLGFHISGNRKIFGNEEAGGERKRGDDFFAGRMERKPGELESSREQVVPARFKNPGAKRDTASRVGLSR